MQQWPTVFKISKNKDQDENSFQPYVYFNQFILYNRGIHVEGKKKGKLIFWFWSHLLWIGSLPSWLEVFLLAVYGPLLSLSDELLLGDYRKKK